MPLNRITAIVPDHHPGMLMDWFPSPLLCKLSVCSYFEVCLVCRNEKSLLNSSVINGMCWFLPHCTHNGLHAKFRAINRHPRTYPRSTGNDFIYSIMDFILIVIILYFL